MNSKVMALFALAWAASSLAAQEIPASRGLAFIDTSFENASPLWYDTAEDGTVRIHLIYDHEGDSPNRAAGHIHFKLEGEPGAKLTLEFLNLDNVWNGQPGSVARELRSMAISEDGRSWRSVRPEIIEERRVRLAVEMPGPVLFVARVEPYRLSDLERLLEEIRAHERVAIETIGQTVEGRNLEIVRLGRPDAPGEFFCGRARIRGKLAETGSSRD